MNLRTARFAVERQRCLSPHTLQRAMIIPQGAEMPLVQEGLHKTGRHYKKVDQQGNRLVCME